MVKNQKNKEGRLADIKNHLEKHNADAQLQAILYASDGIQRGYGSAEDFSDLNIAGLEFNLISVEDKKVDDGYFDYSGTEWVFTIDGLKLKVCAYFDSWGQEDKDTMMYRMEIYHKNEGNS